MQTMSQTTLIATNASGIGVIPPGNYRTGLIISLIDGASFKLAFGTTPSGTGGVFVPAAQGFIKLLRSEFGAALDMGITIIAAAGTATTIAYAEAAGCGEDRGLQTHGESKYQGQPR